MLGRRNDELLTALLVIVLASCAGAPAPRTSAGRVGSQEAELFAAAVRHVRSNAKVRTSIDPRPIRISDEIDMPDVADYYQNAVSTTRERAAVLREIGIETVRAFPLRAGCTGFLFPPSKKRTDGCPADVVVEVAFDRVRPARTLDRWLLRAISIHYTPSGRGATTYETTIAARNGRFVVERMVVLVEFD